MLLAHFKAPIGTSYVLVHLPTLRAVFAISFLAVLSCVSMSLQWPCLRGLVAKGKHILCCLLSLELIKTLALVLLLSHRWGGHDV